MREPAVNNLDVDQAIRAACLSFPLRPHGKGGSVSATLSFVSFKLTVTWKTAFCNQVRRSITRRKACRETASQHPELVKQTSTKTYTYTGIEHDNIKLALTRCKIIPNSANQNRIGMFPDLSSSLAEWKVWLARLCSSHLTVTILSPQTIWCLVEPYNVLEWNSSIPLI